MSSLVMVSRAFERLGIAAAGIFSIWLGYQLFASLPMLPAESGGQVELPGGVSIYLSRVGPGVFFALFGAAILVWLAYRQLTYEETRTAEPQATERSDPRALPPPADVQSVRWALAAQAPADLAVSGYRPMMPVSDVVMCLNQLQKNGADRFTGLERLRIDPAVAEAKLAVMEAAWQESWGPRESFRAWVHRGTPASDPPPLENTFALKLFAESGGGVQEREDRAVG